MKGKLIQEAYYVLESTGYRVLDCSGLRSCFDLIARKDKIILIKVIANIDGLTRRNCGELQDVASMLDANAFVLGSHTKNTKLVSGVIYARYGVNVLNLATLGEVLDENIPCISSVRGNYCMHIDSRLLVALRKELSLTQQDLADELNVSKQTIHRYELSGRVSLEVAQRLMKILENNISVPANFFKDARSMGTKPPSIPVTSLKQSVLEKIRELGFSASLTNAPFDIVAIEGGEERVLITVSDDSRRLMLKINVINEVSEILGSYSVCISNRRVGSANFNILRPHELIELTDPRDFIKLISEL